MDCYLELAAKTPLDFLHREYFPHGFPAKQQCTGMPERFKRSCGTIFWKLSVPMMSQLQRRAILNYYHYSITTQRTDWTPLLNSVPGLAEEAGLENILTSVLSAEPPNAAIVFVESCPAIADYCISQSFWELWYRRYAMQRLQTELVLLEEKRSQQQLAAAISQQVAMPPLIKQRSTETLLADWNTFNHSPPTGF